MREHESREPFAYIIQDKYERERGVEGHLSRSHVSKYVSQEDINEHEITCTPLYRHAQQPVVPDERAAFNAWNNEDNLPIAGVGAKNAAWLAWQARAMLQAGNSPVIPDGYVMVPKEPTEEMNKAGWAAMNEHDAINPTYRAMLAAAPHDTPALNSVQSVVTVSDTWIPVSERMPEVGQKVLVYRPKAHKDGDPNVSITVYATYRFQHGFGCYWEPSHWMPLPAAPQEPKP